jgi:hypothetical protein
LRPRVAQALLELLTLFQQRSNPLIACVLQHVALIDGTLQQTQHSKPSASEYGFQVSDSQVLNLYPFHVFKDYLKSIKTPSFKKTSHKNWFLKFFTQKLTNR